MGLGIVAFYSTFVPGYQTTIQGRQVKVAWLYARAKMHVLVEALSAKESTMRTIILTAVSAMAIGLPACLEPQHSQ